MLSSAFVFAVLDGLIKVLGPCFRVWDIAIYRFGAGLVILTTLFGWKTNLFKGQNQKLLIIRGMTGSMAFFSLVTAIRLIPISTSMVLFYSFPAFAALFSQLLFRDRITKIETLCIFLALLGASVLFDFRLEGALFGQFMGILAGAFAGLTVSIIKKLREANGPIVIYFYFCLIGSAITFPVFIADPRIPSTQGEWVILGGIVFSSTIAQLLMTQGFRFCKSWEGGLFLMSEVIFTSIFGIFFLSELVTWRFWSGGLLILGSVIALNRDNARRFSYRGVPSHET
jgi:drug/metabolite transporter (DMT)-like permease